MDTRKAKRELQKPKCEKQVQNSSLNNREEKCKEKWKKAKRGTQKTKRELRKTDHK